MPASRRRAPVRGVAALCVFAVVAVVGLPAAASVEERRLRQAQDRLAEVRERIDTMAGERERHADALEEADRELRTVLEAVNQAELAVRRQQGAVEAARHELEVLEDRAREHRQVMTDRAVTLYRQGTTASWAALFGAGDADEALQRSTYVEIVSRADREVFERAEIDQVALEAQRLTLEAEEETLQRVLARQREIHAEVEALRDERALQLAGIDEELAKLRSEQQHLESERRELAAMARRASQARQATAARSGSGRATASTALGPGGWGWPAAGPVTSGFGMRWGRLHEGVDIGARPGSPVVAARDGRVSFAGRMGGYGNLVLLNHGGGVVTAYAHLSSISVGTGGQVRAGQRIGAVGCTGSCTGPHLHFEVRVNGSARNPLGYLP